MRSVMSESLRTADWVNKGAKAKGFKDPLFYNGSQYTKHMKNPHPLSANALRPSLGRVLRGWLSLGLAWGCVCLPALSQSDMPQAWQPGEVANVTQTDDHQEVRKLLRQAKYTAALTWVEGSLKKNPRDPQMLFWRAFIHEQTGQADKALPMYLSLTQDYPELPEPHNNLGVLYAAKGLRRDAHGHVVRAGHIFAKVSRDEVARQFLSPAPEAMLSALVAEGRLNDDIQPCVAWP